MKRIYIDKRRQVVILIHVDIKIHYHLWSKHTVFWYIGRVPQWNLSKFPSEWTGVHCPSLPAPPILGMLDIPGLSVWKCSHVNWIFVLLGSGSSHTLDQVEFVALFAGEDGRLFVVFHQLLHRVKLPLSNAVHVVLQLDFEMLVFGLSFQRYWKVIGLEKENIQKFKFRPIAGSRNLYKHIYKNTRMKVSVNLLRTHCPG